MESSRLSSIETNLFQRIRDANASVAQPLSAEDISHIVSEVVSTLAGDVTAADLKFYAELEELAAYIRHAKQEIAEIKPKDISDSHIPHATDELDAVVGATEEATNKIMDECDVISGIAPSCPQDINEKLVACTTRIFEACNFQDITGQRITKVVQTLKFIDAKISALMGALGEEINKESLDILHNKSEEQKLLNGPQLPHMAIGQSEIDKMMSGD